LAARTVNEVLDAYNDGSSINYNPNTIIEMLDSIIDDVFVTEGRSENKKPLPVLNESGGTGSGTISVVDSSQSGGFLSGLFSRSKTKTLSANPIKIDEKRKEMQKKQNVIFEHQRSQNKVVSDFLFKNTHDDPN